MDASNYNSFMDNSRDFLRSRPYLKLQSIRPVVLFTTGATTNECARVLRRAGAKRVDVLAVAVAKRLQ